MSTATPVFCANQWQGNNYSGADYNVMADTTFDTLEIHSVKQIDDHLVIQDTVIIKETIEKIQSLNEDAVNSKDLGTKIVSFIAIILVLVSLVNHYIKRKNG
jgi:hypothetical protein